MKRFVRYVESLSLTVVEVEPVGAVLLASSYQPAVSGVQLTTQRTNHSAGDRNTAGTLSTQSQPTIIVTQ
jgi:hypothetical protein